ncbi:hypothetical protein OGAPHI_004142 [Ogataea philodendri]|uniref:CTP-dependent diacylglycerol kinase 1 n=1 Tax=Ogataea philodendri TaxID=1378263 RepID=A0A9P8P5M8_9ASCO|nr:uncharacterized protein OGAPHI_004142 [Ogataea philodendri]KAH3665953.1 hypothetical protein OGAPHI_004142 [Ogataea philodendri]
MVKKTEEASVPSIVLDKEDTFYNEEDDPDYTLDSTGASFEDEEAETELESEISNTNDEEVSSVSTEFETLDKKHLGQLDIRQRSENPSTADLILETHRNFKKFIHKHEVPRKVFHVSIGFITLYLYTINVQTPQLVRPLLAGFLGVGSLDLLRFRSDKFNRLYCKAVGFLMREKEINTYNGVIWYLLGLYLVFVTQKKDIAVMAVLLLSWSDTAASTFGRMFGHLTPKIFKKKSLAGSLAACLTGVASSYLFYGYFVPQYPEVNLYSDFAWNPSKSYLNIHTLSILSGLVASVSEALVVFDWDDNFTIPVFSSCFLWVVIKLSAKT